MAGKVTALGRGPSRVVLTPRSDSVRQHLNPAALVRTLWTQRGLIAQFTRREVEGRYRSSFLGFTWSFLQPLVLLVIYTFVFGVVLKARWPGAKSGSLPEFGLVLFAGLIVFGIFSESLNRAPTLIVSVPNYVKRVVFPLEVLPVCVVGSALIHAVVSLVVLLGAGLLVNGQLPWTVVFVPLAAMPLVLVTLGLAWFLASLGVFVRDVGHIVGLAVQVLLFATPIFYPLEAIPERFRPFISANPLTTVVENVRRVIFTGEPPQWVQLGTWTAVTGVIMMLGYAWFMKTKKAFADVI